MFVCYDCRSKQSFVVCIETGCLVCVLQNKCDFVRQGLNIYVLFTRTVGFLETRLTQVSVQ